MSVFNSDKISASYDTLLRQASMTAAEYLDRAIDNIDNALGEGYAKKHPELIAAMIKTAAKDYGDSTSGKIHQQTTEALVEATSKLAESLASIAENLERIADSRF